MESPTFELTRSRRRLAPAALVLLLPFLVAAAPQQCSLEGRVYGLTADSHLEYGCWAPLRCPVFLAEDLGGTFRLIGLDDASAEGREFLVSDLHFLARVGDEDWRITGAGSYARRPAPALSADAARVSKVTVEHRLELDLDIDGEADHFDSGWVPAQPDEFPAIDIRISKNGETGLDTVLDLAAIPF